MCHISQLWEQVGRYERLDAKKMRSLYEEQSQKSALKRRHEAK